MKHETKILLLSNDDLILGELHAESSDFPWVMGRFLANEPFREVSEIFSREQYFLSEIEELEQLIRNNPSLEEKHEEKYDLLRENLDQVELDIENLGLQLFNTGTNEKRKIVTIHINGNKFEYK